VELVSYDMPTKRGETLLLMPVGDIQWAGEHKVTALDRLKRHIEWGVEHGAWFLGMGDYIDFASPSNRQRLRAAALYDTADEVIEDTSFTLMQELYEKALKPSTGRWLGLLEGHHFYTSRAWVTTDQRLAELLKTAFLGTSAFVRLRFLKGLRASGRSTEAAITVWCHHGAGGGQRAGSPLNRLDQLLVHWDADIYVMGHQSKKVGAPLDRIEPLWPRRSGSQPGRLIHRTKIIACTGSFMLGYKEGHRDGKTPRGSYVEQKMLAPVELGGVLIRITPRFAMSSRTEGKRSEYWLPDLSVEA